MPYTTFEEILWCGTNGLKLISFCISNVFYHLGLNMISFCISYVFCYLLLQCKNDRLGRCKENASFQTNLILWKRNAYKILKWKDSKWVQFFNMIVILILILSAGLHLFHQRIIQRSGKLNLNYNLHSAHIFKVLDLFFVSREIWSFYQYWLTCISCHPAATEHSWFSLADSTVKKYHQQLCSLLNDNLSK